MSWTCRFVVVCGAGWATAGLLVLLAACDGKSRETPPASEALAGDSEHGLHVVHSERLRTIMDELRALNLLGLAQDPEVEWHSGRDPVKVAQLASELASDARLIPTVYRGTEMTVESRRVFDELAATLERECRELGRLAAKDDRARMKAKVAEIVDTCNACHANFRGPVLALAAPRGLRG